MIQKRFLLVPVLILSLVSPFVVSAQETDDDVNVVEESGKKVIYKAKTEISFDGVDVEGEIKKPAGAYLLDRKKSKFSPLIKFRQDFDKEMLSSVHEVK